MKKELKERKLNKMIGTVILSLFSVIILPLRLSKEIIARNAIYGLWELYCIF